jgi:hypothetical protein
MRLPAWIAEEALSTGAYVVDLVGQGGLREQATALLTPVPSNSACAVGG